MSQPQLTFRHNYATRASGRIVPPIKFNFTSKRKSDNGGYSGGAVVGAGCGSRGNGGDNNSYRRIGNNAGVFGTGIGESQGGSNMDGRINQQQHGMNKSPMFQSDSASRSPVFRNSDHSPVSFGSPTTSSPSSSFFSVVRKSNHSPINFGSPSSSSSSSSSLVLRKSNHSPIHFGSPSPTYSRSSSPFLLFQFGNSSNSNNAKKA